MASTDKKILITGAGGFIGSHLTERCVELGYNVKALVHYNSRNNWGWLEDSVYKNDFEIVPGDIRDYDSVHSAMRGCDTAFHLAALIGIPYSYNSPLAYIKTNIEGTYNVLQAAKELGTGNILITSTSETYGTAQYVPIDEKHPMVGQSPYSATKIAADQLALSFYLSFGLPVKIVRPFNTYGPRQSARAIIPTIVIQILNGQKSLNLGNIDTTRDLTFVKDTVNGFIEIAKTDRLFGEIANIGMSEEISIEDLADLISKLMGADVNIETDPKRVRPDKSEVIRLLCDNKKIITNTIWKPEYNLEKGLKETIKWIKNNINYYKSEIYNI
jgi:dTDP-glucose 4,6-dehydratase